MKMLKKKPLYKQVGSAKTILLSLVLVLLSSSVFAQDGILKELLETVENSAEYDQVKLQQIDSLKDAISRVPEQELKKRYELNTALYDEFKIFNQDSAFYYGRKTRRLAVALDTLPLIQKAVLNLADVTVSAGMYKETLDLLEDIEISAMPEDLRSLYFGLLGRVYSELSEYSNLEYYSSRYKKLAADYRRQALQYTQEGTFFHGFLEAFISYTGGNTENALKKFKDLLETDLAPRESALVHFLLGDLYQKTGNDDLAISHFARASIIDVRTSTKETLAMIRLSELLFKKDDLKNASFLIQKANEDAAFYGAQHRKLQVGAILPLIEEKVIKRIEEQRERLYRQTIITSFLLLFVMGLAVVIYMQVRRLKTARKSILKANENLKLVNKEVIKVNEEIHSKNLELEILNNRLLEANKIKEEYIGFFFSRDADLFEKFGEFKSKLEKEVKAENLDKAKYTLSNYDLKHEKEKLMKSFDEAFIKLFPNFVEEFNSLLKEEEQVKLKKGQFLNKELRIFALMRLGIKHNEIIAQILGYSVNSIYAYKTKIRKKSVLEKKEFDQKLEENTTLKL